MYLAGTSLRDLALRHALRHVHALVAVVERSDAHCAESYNGCIASQEHT